MPRQLVIMARAPVMGRVKSRLAADIGLVTATSFYRHELSRLVRILGQDPRWGTTLAVTPDSSAGASFRSGHLPPIAQGRGDLGERMGRIMRAMPPGPVVIVGSDVPQLGPGHIARAFAALGAADAVFGPASDGGYYLVGLRRVPRVPNAFCDVRWSGPHALCDTLANLEGLTTAFLEPLGDIDTGDDWRRWRDGAVTDRPALNGVRCRTGR
jgi:rSAM/selenodomain-associated transferase 1